MEAEIKRLTALIAERDHTIIAVKNKAKDFVRARVEAVQEAGQKNEESLRAEVREGAHCRLPCSSCCTEAC